MSVIDKKPFINSLLGSCSSDELKDLFKYVNGEKNGDGFKSLVPQSPYALSVSDKVADKVSEITLEVYGMAQRLYHGYLIYNSTYCTLIAFSSKKNQQLTMINMDLAHYAATGLWKFEAMPCELSILELRVELGLLLVEVGEMIEVQVNDINSEGELEGKVIISDGNGGAEWGDSGLDENEVKQLIKNDKDIISQVTSSYDQASDQTTLTFPAYVLPLRMDNLQTYVYFDYYNGKAIDGSEAIVANISFSANGEVKVVYSGDVGVDIVDLDYIYYNGRTLLNTWKLYHIPNAIPDAISYLTTAPSAANTDGLKVVVLDSEPATKYDGYLYVITED